MDIIYHVWDYVQVINSSSVWQHLVSENGQVTVLYCIGSEVWLLSIYPSYVKLICCIE